jgi:NAD-dependent dihydropyrimidine dehydrogenase PreA subunit
MDNSPYQHLAQRLDMLPQGFPPSQDGVELVMLSKLFLPEEAELASHLRITPETAEQVAARTGSSPVETKKLLKAMVRRGLVGVEKIKGGLGFHIIPFAVGIYENQGDSLSREVAELFERYYRQVLGSALTVEPFAHRVIPVNESVQSEGSIRPYESVAQIVGSAQAWGVVDCICRKQKALIGEGCDHPLDVCLQLSSTAGAFDGASWIRALTREEAVATLKRAADAGLVHSVSNTKNDVWYICNCCTCSCGIMRGIVDLGLASVMAHSGFINQVDEDLCIQCGECVEHCPFKALHMEESLVVDEIRCAGCGVCNPTCPEGALHLISLPEADLIDPPESNTEWRRQRAAARGQNLEDIL